MINDLWYKNAIIYCLSVATYMDANGDGRGDSQGLMRRLDYLQGMGVTAIWLMPFQPSPERMTAMMSQITTASTLGMALWRFCRIHSWLQTTRIASANRPGGQPHV
jgi:Alpha amylase, catalytic domain